jgi:hypothetical protein
MNRCVSEVTVMAAKMKDNAFKVPGNTESVAETIIMEANKKVSQKSSLFKIKKLFQYFFVQGENEKIRSHSDTGKYLESATTTSP